MNRFSKAVVRNLQISQARMQQTHSDDSSEQSSDDENDEAMTEGPAATKLYALLKGEAKSVCGIASHRSSTSHDYCKELPYLDLPEDDFLEDVRKTKWSHHFQDIMKRLHYMAKVLERTRRINCRTYETVLKQLAKILSTEVLSFLDSERERWCNCLEEEQEEETACIPFGHRASKYAHSWLIFSDIPHLRHVLLNEHWKYLMPALAFLSSKGMETVALKSVVDATGMPFLLPRVQQRLQAWQRKQPALEGYSTAILQEVSSRELMDSGFVLDSDVFEDPARLKAALLPAKYVFLLPALMCMSAKGKEDEAFAAIFEASGQEVAMQLYGQLKEWLADEAASVAEAAKFYDADAIARGQYPDHAVELEVTEEMETEKPTAADWFWWHLLETADSNDPPCLARKGELCQNPDCPFGLSQSKRRRYRGKGHKADDQRCLFCSPTYIVFVHDTSPNVLIRELCELIKFSKAKFYKGLNVIRECVGPQQADIYAAKVAAKVDGKKPKLAKNWKEVLHKRKVYWREPGEDRDIFMANADKDSKRVFKKFPHVFGPHSVVDKSWMSDRSQAFETWCLSKSWRICAKCNRLEKCKLKAVHLMGTDKFKPQLLHCKHCKSKGAQGYPVKQPEDVPRFLKDLPWAVLDSLSLIEVDTGPVVEAFNGYRMHTSLTRLRWKAESLEVNIHKLPRDQRKLARKAAKKLVRNSPQSSYRQFYFMHSKFLEQRLLEIEKGDISEDAPIQRLPVRFMETVGLECAIWPYLYWETTMCESWVRSQDKRRLNRKKQAFADDPSSDESDPDSEDEEAPVKNSSSANEGCHQSAKASYLAKVMGPILGYGANWDLFQFQYDLWMATTIGGAKNSAGISTRAALSGKSLSPEYWRKFHMALVDLQEQIGLPQFFITVAPYEWSFPYHEWVQDEMEKLCRKRLRLPVAETLHLAHVLTQVVKELMTGANDGQTSKGQHIFAGENDGLKRTVLNWEAWLFIFSIFRGRRFFC